MGNDNEQITKEQRNKQQNNISENIILNKEGSYDVQIYIKEVKPINTQRKIRYWSYILYENTFRYVLFRLSLYFFIKRHHILNPASVLSNFLPFWGSNSLKFSQIFLVADMRLYTLPCRSVRRSITNFVEFRAIVALRPLPNCPRLFCRVSGLVF